MRIFILIFLYAGFGFGCSMDNNKQGNNQPKYELPSDEVPKRTFSREFLYNKVSGMLLGSAIGDAMGAPTEMWSRSMIKAEYGYVNSLVPMVRAPSAEGTWEFNLPAGGTTDDTRWKVLLVDFLTNGNSSRHKPLEAGDFARYLVERYKNEIDALKATDSFDPTPYEDGMRKISWLQEWAVVAQAFASNEIETYTNALNRFYGGEMVCAGLLFSPAIGAYYPGDPLTAYEQCFRIDIYDLGFAKDISGLTAAMVAAAIPAESTPDTILSVFRSVDPQQYFKSRLVGRMAHKLLKEAQGIVYQARQTSVEEIFGCDSPPAIPPNSRHDSLYHAQLEKAYQMLDAHRQTMPFHAAEIHLVNLTAMLFSDFHFQRAMEFVINYGRDNDTTAAVTGAILGAYLGADKLPEIMVKEIIKTNQTLGIDFEKIAETLVDTVPS